MSALVRLDAYPHELKQEDIARHNNVTLRPGIRKSYIETLASIAKRNYKTRDKTIDFLYRDGGCSRALACYCVVKGLSFQVVINEVLFKAGILDENDIEFHTKVDSHGLQSM